MSKLAAELLRFDKEAEDLYSRLTSQEHAVLSQAREQAMTMVQEAERRFGKEREDAIAVHAAQLTRKKEIMQADATAAAEHIRTSSQPRIALTAQAIVHAVIEDAAQ